MRRRAAFLLSTSAPTAIPLEDKRVGSAYRFLYPFAVLLGFLALLYAAYAIIAEVLSFPTGWDLEVTCSARNALSHGLDPYKVSNIGTWLSYPYSPTVAYLAAPLCFASTIYPKLYLIIYALIVTLSGLVLGWELFSTPTLTFLTGLIFFTGFDGLRWLLITGNLAILELPIAIALLIAFRRQHFVLSGALLGIMSSFKLLPIIFSLAFFVVELSLRRATRVFFTCTTTFIISLIISFAATPDLFMSFVTQLHGGFPGQHSPWVEHSASAGDIDPTFIQYNPNFIHFYIELLSRITGKRSLLESGLALTFFVIGGTIMYVGRKILKDKDGMQIAFGLAIVLLSLTLFRLKPYAYMTLVPFGLTIVAFLGNWPRLIAMITLGLSCVLWRKLPSVLSDMYFNYYQLLGLLSFIVISAALLAFTSHHPQLEDRARHPHRISRAR